jgi:hypothetical protein
MATGHIRRIAPINQDRTRSGVSRFMDACKHTFIHLTCQAVFRFPQLFAVSSAPHRSL